MKTRIIALCSVALFALAGCGNIPVAPTVTSNDANALASVQDFATAAVDTTNNPDLAKELAALKDLPADQRKAKLDELKAKYPDAFKACPNPGFMGRGPVMGKIGPGMKGAPGMKGGRMEGNKGGMPNLKNLETSNPELAAALKTLRDLPADQRKAKLDELKAKYPDAFKPQRLLDLEKNFPDAAKELEAIQKDYQAKMDALKTKYPDAFKKPAPKVVPSASPSPSASPTA